LRFDGRGKGGDELLSLPPPPVKWREKIKLGTRSSLTIYVFILGSFLFLYFSSPFSLDLSTRREVGFISFLEEVPRKLLIYGWLLS